MVDRDLPPVPSAAAEQAEGSAEDVEFQIRTGTGWNTNLAFNLESATRGRDDGTSITWNVAPADLDQIQQIFIKLVGYTNDGLAYVDNIRLAD